MELGIQFDRVSTFVFDVDGVLTDGTVILLPDLSTQARRMHVKDGYALQLAIKTGYRVKVISGAVSEPVSMRLKSLGVTDVSMGIKDKAAHLQAYMMDNKIQPDELLFMGDDIPDLEAMKLAGLPCCPADAVAEIRAASVYVATGVGGAGCVREVIEKVLRARGDWQTGAGLSSL